MGPEEAEFGLRVDSTVRGLTGRRRCCAGLGWAGGLRREEEGDGGVEG